MIQLHDKQFVPYLSAQQIDQAIASIAQQIQAKYADQIPLFIGVLNGSFRFVADLLKHYPSPCEVSFVKLSSYQGTQTTHNVTQLIGLNTPINNRVVILVEDIVDTGNTLVQLMEMFKPQQPQQLEVATLFLKPEVYNKNIPITYVGMEIPNKFIVGYGLDYDELGRNLNEVYQLYTP